MNTLKISGNGKTFDVDKAVEALRVLWDLMEFYIWHPTLDTANAIKGQNAFYLKDKITGAIHQRHLTKEVKSAIKAQLDYWQDRKISEPYTMDDKYIKWTYHGIPVELKILKIRWKFFDNFNPVTFNFDDYKLANPWDSYWKSRFLLR